MGIVTSKNSSSTSTSSRKPVIAIGGLACETSAFSPARSTYSSFLQWRGSEIYTRYPFLNASEPLGSSATWHCTLVGSALPGGIVTRDAFEALAGEIVGRLKQLIATTTLDGFWYDIHGAMVVEDMDDCEAELLRRIRAVIGTDVVVSASMDLHGNVSRDLAHMCDLITCYRTAPHVDVQETKERACRNLLDVLKRRDTSADKTSALPIKAWIPIPVLLAGEQTSTRMEPAKSIYAAVPTFEATDGVLDASVWVGYAWADEPRDRAVVVVTGHDLSAVKAGAEKLATMFWASHTDFNFVAPVGTLAESLATALSSPLTSRPFFISDSGDNPTAGGAGDVTWTLSRILAQREFSSSAGPTVIYASIPGPAAVATAIAAGIGSIVTVSAGAEIDHVHAGPVTMTGRVHAIKHGDKWAKVEVVLHVGSVFVIVTQQRKPYHLESDYTDLLLRPREADIVIVKIGYLEPELYAMAKGWIMALTPGGVDQDLLRLGHKRIERPMYPFDKVFLQPPDLRARIIPPSSETLSPDDE